MRHLSTYAGAIKRRCKTATLRRLSRAIRDSFGDLNTVSFANSCYEVCYEVEIVFAGLQTWDPGFFQGEANEPSWVLAQLSTVLQLGARHSLVFSVSIAGSSSVVGKKRVKLE